RHFLSPVPSSASLLRRPLPGSTVSRITPPAEVAVELNQRFQMDPLTGQYFTLLNGVLDLEAREFSYVSAGHPAPVHLSRERGSTFLTAAGFPIGVLEEATYQERVVPLQPGDRLYLYSDGILEAFNARDEQFGRDRLLRTLEQGRTLPLRDSLALLLATVEEWRGGTHLVADVSVRAVRLAVPPTPG